MERCPHCDMDEQPEIIKVHSYKYDIDTITATVQCRCPECRGMYQKKEIFRYETHTIE